MITNKGALQSIWCPDKRVKMWAQICWETSMKKYIDQNPGDSVVNYVRNITQNDGEPLSFWVTRRYLE